MGRTALLDVTLRAVALGVAASIVAICTWAALDLGGATAPAHTVPAARLERASAVSRGGAPGSRLGFLGAPVGLATSEGLRVTIVDGGWPVQLSVQRGTVLDLLRASLHELGPEDRVDPPLEAALVPGMIVHVVRGSERLETVDETMPAPTVYETNPDLSIGQSQVVFGGHDGTARRTYRVRLEDGVAVGRSLVSEAVLDVALAARVAVGTRPLSLTTPYGDLSYVRAIDVVATYYTPANGGKAPGSPLYAITATGARATRGIVAVDPRVIPMYSWLYIPGYGIAQARDVGSAIIGDHIDVAFDDGDGAWWGRRFLTVYILAP